MGMHLGHQGCTDTKEQARMPAYLAFRTILGSSENIAFRTVLPHLPETENAFGDPFSVSIGRRQQLPQPLFGFAGRSRAQVAK